MFANPFKRLSGRKNTSSRRRVTSFRPRVEGLDDRIVPAVVSIEQDLVSRVATITANDAADNIAISDPGTGGVTVTGTGITGNTVLDAAIRTIRVSTNGGADTVSYTLADGNLTRSIKVDVDLGGGNDRFTADLNGRNIDNNSTLNLKVQGGWGADSISVDAEGTDTNRVHVRAGSTLRMELLGGSDFDPFDGADTIDVRYRGEMDGTLILKAVGGQGDDSITSILTLSGGSSGRVKGDGTAAARVEGGQGADALDFRVRDNSGGTAGVSAEVDGGLDWDTDTVRHTTNVTAFNAFGSENIFVT
ncbi:MAG TPA: hypothetical protein VL371_16760 [Gemmataceae bacterium]|nr:hypothetical protein [Gemmataceae bacterium]